MKKTAVLIFTRILYVLFLVGTIISLFIVYRDVDGNFDYKFLMGYLYFALFMILYVPFITFYNSRRLKWVEIRKRLVRFVTLFISFGILNFVFDYFFRPSNIDFYREISVAIGLSFGISFVNVTFMRSKLVEE
ncbi:MAG: hypothetical protein AB6733_01305 [Clostridiaceae bacterium]